MFEPYALPLAANDFAPDEPRDQAKQNPTADGSSREPDRLRLPYARGGERLPPSTVATGKSLCGPLRVLL